MRRASLTTLAVALVVALSAPSGAAVAQTPPVAPAPVRSTVAAPAGASACPAGNLLAGRTRWQWINTIRSERINDGVAVNEGAVWNAVQAAVMEVATSTVTFDLGQVVPLHSAWIQADANDEYTVWGSVDAREFREIGRVRPVEGVHGLRSRTLQLGGMPVRYFRFGEGQGDGAYSVSEIQLFCQPPASYPAPLKHEQAAVATVEKNLWYYWNDRVSVVWELVLAVLGLALLQWGLWLRQRGRPDAHKKLRDRLLMALGAISALTYINFGAFHFGGTFIHDWEWTHYYIGSKYFKELSYDRLYECIAIADSEEGPTQRKAAEKRKLTNLRTNHIEPTTIILGQPQACKQHFSSARWDSFKSDVRFFRNRQGAKRWDDLQLDHGYNGTPVWNVAGTLLTNTGPASKPQLYTLAMLDLAYLAGTIAVVWWAFGWRVLSIALLVFATNFPSRFYWTGGSFLRWDWLFYLVASICCLRKDRPVLGGAALAYSALLRVFPGFVFLGPALGLGYYIYKHRKLEPRYTRFFVGAALATLVLVPASLAASGGIHGYRRFIENTVKHKETPLTNYMGLRTVLAYRPSTAGKMVKDERLTDPWIKWKQARLDGWKQAKPLYVLLALGFVVLLFLAARHAEPWMATAMGITFIPLGVELTCYYYAFILGVALLYEKREEVGHWLLYLTAATSFIAWGPLPRMSHWLDEQYTVMSLATVAVFALILWRFRDPQVAGAAAAASEPESAPAATSAATSAGKTGAGTGKRKRPR
jgi:hypothetical protein